MSEIELRGLASPSRSLAAASASLTICFSLASLGVAESVEAVKIKNVAVVYSYENVLPASRLSIAQPTVKIHRRHVMEKMGADSIANLVRIVEKSGGSTSKG